MKLDKIKYEIIHAVHYFDRELFLLKIENKYTMVYKGSGLNNGKVGRILPFFYLLDKKPRFGDAKKGIITGYIFKEFYFNREIISHYKNMNIFGKGVLMFLDRLEKDLNSYKVEKKFQDMKDIKKYAKDFNDIVHSYMKIYETKPVLKTNWFDWGTLNLYYNIDSEK